MIQRVLSLLIPAFLMSSAFANADIYLGAMAGLQKPSEGSFKARLGYGLDGGYQLLGTISVGGTLLYSNKSVIGSTATTSAIDVGLTTFHLNARFSPLGSIFFGAGAGLTGVSMKT